MKTIVMIIISILCFVNTSSAKMLSEDEFVDKIADKYGKAIVVDYIMENNSGIITIERNGITGEYIGRPSGEFINGKTILTDIRKIGIDVLDFEAAIDTKSKEYAKTIGGHHWKRENGVLVVQQTKRTLKPVSLDEPKAEPEAKKVETKAELKKPHDEPTYDHPAMYMNGPPRPSLDTIKIPQDEAKAKVVKGFIEEIKSSESKRGRILTYDEYNGLEKSYFRRFSRLEDGTVVEKSEDNGEFSKEAMVKINADVRAKLEKVPPLLKDVESYVKYVNSSQSGVSQEKTGRVKVSLVGKILSSILTLSVPISSLDPELSSRFDEYSRRLNTASRIIENSIDEKAKREADRTHKKYSEIKQKLSKEASPY